jgi:hypothetical protein
MSNMAAQRSCGQPAGTSSKAQDDPECLERVSNSFGSENCMLHVLREDVQAERTKAIGEGVP